MVKRALPPAPAVIGGSCFALVGLLGPGDLVTSPAGLRRAERDLARALPISRRALTPTLAPVSRRLTQIICGEAPYRRLSVDRECPAVDRYSLR